MVLAAKPGGLICTVIDEGLLNTDTGVELRRWVMQHAELETVLQLPDVTFKPNKINVRSSILLLRRREDVDTDLLDSYPVTFGILDTLGYHGTGEPMRGFDFAAVRESIGKDLLNRGLGPERSGPSWRAFDVPASVVAADGTTRWDCKYWNPTVRNRTADLLAGGGVTLRDLNQVETRRGRSPKASTYVDEPEGYAVVVKAGSCITRYGQVTLQGADWIEKQVFDDLPDEVNLEQGDVLLSSTGEGTLGKAGVWDLEHEAIADGHITILRVDPDVVDPYYLADYLRVGFGQDQIQRLYTGSTGLIELTAEHVNGIAVSALPDTEEQARLSAALREAESEYQAQLGKADDGLRSARQTFEEKSAS